MMFRGWFRINFVGMFRYITPAIVLCAGYLTRLPVFFGKCAIYKLQNTIRFYKLIFDDYLSPLFVYFLTCKDVSQFRHIVRE
jgi:hypothetical protein